MKPAPFFRSITGRLVDKSHTGCNWLDTCTVRLLCRRAQPESIRLHMAESYFWVIDDMYRHWL